MQATSIMYSHFKKRYITRLLHLLSDEYLNMKFLAANAIGKLTLNSVEVQDYIYNEKQFMQKLVSLLPSADIGHTNQNKKAVSGWSTVAWTLAKLTNNNQGNRKAIRQCGGIHRLVRLLVINAQPLCDEYSVVAV